MGASKGRLRTSRSRINIAGSELKQVKSYIHSDHSNHLLLVRSDLAHGKIVLY